MNVIEGLIGIPIPGADVSTCLITLIRPKTGEPQGPGCPKVGGASRLGGARPRSLKAGNAPRLGEAHGRVRPKVGRLQI